MEMRMDSSAFKIDWSVFWTQLKKDGLSPMYNTGEICIIRRTQIRKISEMLFPDDNWVSFDNIIRIKHYNDSVVFIEQIGTYIQFSSGYFTENAIHVIWLRNEDEYGKSPVINLFIHWIAIYIIWFPSFLQDSLQARTFSLWAPNPNPLHHWSYRYAFSEWWACEFLLLGADRSGRCNHHLRIQELKGIPYQ